MDLSPTYALEWVREVSLTTDGVRTPEKEAVLASYCRVTKQNREDIDEAEVYRKWRTSAEITKARTKLQNHAFNKAGVTLTKAVEEAWLACLANPLDAFDSGWNVKDVTDIPRGVGKLIKSVSINRRPGTEEVRVTFNDSTTWMNLVMRMKGYDASLINNQFEQLVKDNKVYIQKNEDGTFEIKHRGNHPLEEETSTDSEDSQGGESDLES